MMCKHNALAKASLSYLVALTAPLLSLAQTPPDSAVNVSTVTIIGQKGTSDLHLLPEIVGTNVYAGKKGALIVMENVQGNVATNVMRQVAAKIPGIVIWESEGSGMQINIATRGLSPNRSWEFNVRQNGYDIAADPYGYPEAYYNPQLQAVQRIEVIRGQGALQYGAQIGGMVNYILKNGSEFTKPFQFETFQTLGNNGLFNSYNAIGGKTKKWNYYAFYDHRSGKGWRANNQYRSNTASASVTYQATEKLSFTGEYTYWNALSQQAGGLTDAQFAANPRQSVRSRNWFNLGWQTAALNINYHIAENQRLNVKLFSITGNRNSVGFMPSAGITVADTINAATNAYNYRSIDLDSYRNLGAEARYLWEYKLGDTDNALSAGLRLYAGKTQRLRGGRGSTGTNYNIEIQDGKLWSGDIDYLSQNVAVFAENIFRPTARLNLIPGIRYEYLRASASGYSGLSNDTPIPLVSQSRNRGFVIAGLGAEYKAGITTKLYANAAQSYRPVQFADLTTPPTTDVIDSNLKDARGLNFDLGYKGKIGNCFLFDASLYYLLYTNRIGTIKQQRADGSFYNYRTNIGSSTAKGVEFFGELEVLKALKRKEKYGNLSIFASYAYNDARYQSFKAISVVNNALVETNYQNNRVEYAPANVLRAGIEHEWKGLSTTLQYSYMGKVFTDANNTLSPSVNAQNGEIPAYQLWDLTVSYKHRSGFSLKSGINNLSNQHYFTRRASGYPGPGVLPGDGRTFFVCAGFQLK